MAIKVTEKSELHHSKKIAILESAIEVFVNKGYDAGSMDFIAQHAQVSKRTLYKYFSNKKHLLDEVILYLIEKGQRSLSFTYSPQVEIELQVSQIIKEKVKTMLLPINLKLAKLIIGQHFCETHSEDDLKNRTRIQRLIRNEKTTKAWVKSAQKQGVLNNQVNASEILEVLHSLINGLIFFPVLFEDKSTCTEQDISTAAKCFVSLYRTS